MPLLQENEKRPIRTHYTYADVLTWSEDFRAEIINGEVYVPGIVPCTVLPGLSIDLTALFT